MEKIYQNLDENLKQDFLEDYPDWKDDIWKKKGPARFGRSGAAADTKYPSKGGN